MALVLLTLAAVLFTAPASAATRTTLVRGTVTMSPTRPVCIEGRPCSAPAAGVALVFKRSGRVVARVVTNADGRYRVRLRPGRYVVVAPRYARVGGVAPGVIVVACRGPQAVDFEIDTGLQ